MGETLLGRNFRTLLVKRQNLREHIPQKKIPTIHMNTYVLLISLKKLYRQIILLGNKLDKMYKIKYLFKQNLFGIIPSFACINILSYITCLVYYLIYHSEFIQKNK